MPGLSGQCEDFFWKIKRLRTFPYMNALAQLKTQYVIIARRWLLFREYVFSGSDERSTLALGYIGGTPVRREGRNAA